MIVQTNQSIGLDKVRLWVPDFAVKDAGKSGFTVQGGMVNLETGTTTDELLFRDGGGQQVHGAKAIQNTNLYQATITGNGLLVQLNPSKPYHPVNLVADSDTFNERLQTVFNDLKGKGVQASWNDAKLIRLDIARNINLNGSCTSYGAVWPFINQARSKHVRMYPDGFGTGNDSWGTIFYNKGKETGLDINNLLRGELQLKRNRTVLDAIGCKTYGQLKQYGIEPLQDVYRQFMTDKVLRVKEGANVLTIKYDDEIQVLKKLMVDSPRTAIGKHIQLMGIPYFLETYRSLQIYKEVLIDAGFSIQAVNRNMKKIQAQIQLFTTFYKDERSTVGKMLREIHLKLVA